MTSHQSPETQLAGSLATGTRASYWHVGLVVSDIEAAMAELTATTGAEWLPVQERPDGEDTIRVSFSTATPHVELIEGNPGGLWPTAEGPHLDHLAFWSDDFAADCARFEDRGLARETGGTSVWGGNWAYYRMAASGFRVELCDTAGRAAFLQRWGLGDDPAPG
jgi:hypothetical protein